MKITIYTITECAFSKQEKEYLSAHGLQYEEKNLETNREYLTEMLAVGGNFAGTPVTKIEKDDGQIVVLKGFTAAEFDKALALTPASVVPEAVMANKPGEQTAAPVVEPPQTPEPQIPPVPQAPSVPVATADPAMASVLNTLEQQVAAIPVETVPAATPSEPPQQSVVDPTAPVIPDPQFK